jgi:hypothetical protein
MPMATAPIRTTSTHTTTGWESPPGLAGAAITGEAAGPHVLLAAEPDALRSTVAVGEGFADGNGVLEPPGAALGPLLGGGLKPASCRGLSGGRRGRSPSTAATVGRVIGPPGDAGSLDFVVAAIQGMLVALVATPVLALLLRLRLRLAAAVPGVVAGVILVVVGFFAFAAIWNGLFTT